MIQSREEWDEPTQPVSTAPATTWAKQARQIVIKRWQPEALTLPEVDNDLPRLNAIERSAEVLRYNLHRFEYWISPGGSLREWFKFNLRLAFGIAVPSLLVAPFVTLALRQFDTWIEFITKTTSNLVLVPLSVLLVIGLIAGLVSIARSILVMRMRSQQQRRDPYNY